MAKLINPSKKKRSSRKPNKVKKRYQELKVTKKLPKTRSYQKNAKTSYQKYINTERL
jgi:hypothetical protein